MTKWGVVIGTRHTTALRNKTPIGDQVFYTATMRIGTVMRGGPFCGHNIFRLFALYLSRNM